MTRPPLTLALSLVLSAQVENSGRPGLLATLRPESGRAVTLGAGVSEPDPVSAA